MTRLIWWFCVTLLCSSIYQYLACSSFCCKGFSSEPSNNLIVLSRKLFLVYTCPEWQTIHCQHWIGKIFSVLSNANWIEQFLGYKIIIRNDLKFSDRQVWANSADPHQTAPRGAVWSGSSLFAFALHHFDKIT